ncbi:MAG: NAD-dependent epimerase/dehydratase family protein [Deltaproteobacteria bacterium]|nr:MAG: NAD-dependent epimerase/dehydratase family protein [Deltaproteobacteria bacterium]
MKILILGGTRFLGRHLVTAALEAGHAVTLFHRGRTNPDLYPELERVIGDRDGDLSRLAGRTFDAVIDTCGYHPRIVGASAAFFAERATHYTFISSIAVYRDLSKAGIGEGAELSTVEDPEDEIVTPARYGGLKALCEAAAEAAMPGRVLHLRAGLLAGPFDPTDRFTYWPLRIARGGEILAPGSPEDPVQFLDARDLARWAVEMAERRACGVYNVVGPARRRTRRAFLERCRRVVGGEVTFTWVSEAFLCEAGVVPFTEMPLWVPAAASGLLAVDASRALSEGLSPSPWEKTIRDTWQWRRSIERPLGAGLTPEREAELLRRWKRRPGKKG